MNKPQEPTITFWIQFKFKTVLSLFIAWICRKWIYVALVHYEDTRKLILYINGEAAQELEAKQLKDA